MIVPRLTESEQEDLAQILESPDYRYISRQPEKKILKLLAIEVQRKNRDYLVKRLYGRYSRLRAKRELAELVFNA